MMTSQLLEVYAGGEQIAQFDPDDAMGVEDCRVATECARYVIFRDNADFFNTFQSVIYDGLTARAGLRRSTGRNVSKTPKRPSKASP
jgi:hypothetical protein